MVNEWHIDPDAPDPQPPDLPPVEHTFGFTTPAMRTYPVRLFTPAPQMPQQQFRQPEFSPDRAGPSGSGQRLPAPTRLQSQTTPLTARVPTGPMEPSLPPRAPTSLQPMQQVLPQNQAPIVPGLATTLINHPELQGDAGLDEGFMMVDHPNGELPNGDSDEEGLFKYMREVGTNRKVLVKVTPQMMVRSSPAAHTARAKMPAPPKFGGKLDKDITSIEVWVRDVQRYYAQRVHTPLKEVLEVLTMGDARVNIDNMLRDAATSTLSDAAFADKFVMHYVQQAQPRHMIAREKLFNNVVRMTPGSKLQEYVVEFRAVIMDAAPIQATDAIFYFKQGLQHELKSECLTDALGQAFISLDALITHAFVQEQKLICRQSAPGKSNAQLNQLQGPYQEGSPAKKGRFNGRGGGRGGGNQYGGSPRNQYGGGSRNQFGSPRNDGGGRGGRGGGRGGGRSPGGDRPRTSGRSDVEQRQFKFCMDNGKCAGCYSLLLPVGHMYKKCPNHPDNAGMERVLAPVPAADN
jgi:hypothetical protein